MNPVPALGGRVCCNPRRRAGRQLRPARHRGTSRRAGVHVRSRSRPKTLEVTGSVRCEAVRVVFDCARYRLHGQAGRRSPGRRGLERRRHDIAGALSRGLRGGGVHGAEGEVYELNPTPMSTSYVFKAGHRIRVEGVLEQVPAVHAQPEHRRQQLRRDGVGRRPQHGSSLGAVSIADRPAGSPLMCASIGESLT